MDIERLEELSEYTRNLCFIALSKLTDKNARENVVAYGEGVKELIDEAIARQSVADEAVREAIEFQEKYAKSCQESIEQLERGDVNYLESNMEDGKWTNKCINDDIIAREKREIFLHNLAITALQEYQPKPDCESAEKYGDKCCGYGKSEYDDEPIDVCKSCDKQASYEVED